jgi:hypothetical protein
LPFPSKTEQQKQKLVLAEAMPGSDLVRAKLEEPAPSFVLPYSMSSTSWSICIKHTEYETSGISSLWWQWFN